MKDDQWPPEGGVSAQGASSPEDAEVPGTESQDGPTDGAGAPAGEPPHVRNPLESNQLAESPAAGSRLADDPLAGKQPADDPLGSDPLTLDRRNATHPHSE